MRMFTSANVMKQGNNIHIFSKKNVCLNEETHTHDFIEIIYILSGKATQVVEGLRYEVKHGDMIFMNYGSTHSYICKDTFSFVNICFSPETLENAILTPQNAFSLLSLTAFNEMRSDSNGGKISFFGGEQKEAEDILFAMLREYQNKQTSWDTVMESYLSILITKMLRKTELGLKSEEIGDMWRELSEYIDANLGSDLTPSSLAARCFYNPSYFSRIFKEKFQMSPVEYINRKRVDHAVDLLCNTDFSVDEISLQVGFTDRSSFYHAFSKYVGTPPSDYRKKSEKSKNPTK